MKFIAACAPSKSRPRMSGAKVHADATELLAHLGGSGIAGLTEISNEPARAAVAAVFPYRYHPAGTDTPIVWTEDWTRVEAGKDFGCGRVPGVAPRRHTVWIVLRNRRTGVRVGFVVTHMMPGGWRPSARQRPWVPLIRLRWRRHRARIERRQALLRACCDAVATVGDINHPDAWTFRDDTRASAPGLVYIGVQSVRDKARPGVRRRWDQNADHRAAAVVVDIEGVRP